MKKLEIILPMYAEDIDTVAPMLSSINNQIACTPSDYLLTLVNDCGPTKITEEDVKKYLWKFDFQILKTPENGGPGVARQYGIDHSKAEYVTMGDCDDMLYGNLVFNFFENQLYRDQPDYAHTKWFTYHYQPNAGNIVVPQQGVEFTWFFGKFYKREFLEKYKLREDPRLRVHEEIQIVRLAPYYSTKGKYYDFPTYIWCTSEGSITRRNEQEYAYTGMATYIFSSDILIDKLITLNREEALKQAEQTILLTWSSFQNINYDGKAKDWKEQTEKMASYFINKWEPQIDLQKQQKPEWSALELELYKGMQGQLQKVPKEDYYSWYKRIKNLNIQEIPEFKQPNITATKKGK